MNHLLAIFVAPIGHVIGFFIVICFVAWGLWEILTRFVPAAPPRPRNLGYLVYVIVMLLLFVWWCDFSFGLGIF